MQNNRQSGFLNSRLFIALLLCSAAAWLGVKSFASAPGSPQVPNAPPSCSPPGTLVVSDATGDQNGNPAANQQFDIQSVSIAEPCRGDGSNQLVFTLKVANLSSIPANGHWKIQFVPPTLPAGTTAYFVEMTSDQTSNVSFEYGNVTTISNTVGTTEGTKNADGTITISIANSKVGDPGVGQSITKVQGITQLLVGAAGTGLLLAIDSTTLSGNNPSYTLVGHGSCTCPATTPTPTPAPGAGAGNARFQNYVPPSTASYVGGEPSIGSNWLTGNLMYLASFSAIRISFDDCPSPARDTWTNTNVPAAVSLDPILFTDHIRAPGNNTPNRTFVSQLTGQDSITFFTDNDGVSYTPSQGGGLPSGVDHQTIGAGPYTALLPANPVYPNAVYYCSQDIATAFCARSDDGGVTFGAGVPIYALLDCTGIHGHVKVGPDGSVYVPNRSCGGKAAVVVSKDNGMTWTVKPAPGSSTTGFLVDPSVGIGTNAVGKPPAQASNTIYLGYQAANAHARIAVSHDQGDTWVSDQDVSAGLGLANTTFPEVVAGDDNRASYAFLGTTVAGDYTNPATYPANAPWHLYIATTYDGGVTWTTVDATPTDPVQRGTICNLGTTSCKEHSDAGIPDRNLLDFMDNTVDAQGRAIVGYPDGCVGPCVNDTSVTDPKLVGRTALASVARQSGGKRLFAVNDPNPVEPTAPAPPRVDGVAEDATGLIRITWSVPDNGGATITGYNIYRRTDPGSYGAPLATVPADTTTYVDNTATAGAVYYYKVTALNAQGESVACSEFTISTPPPTNPCAATGFLVDTDPTGDQLLAPSNNDLDVQAVLVAEPYQADGINRLIFTMKVASLETIPANRQWRIIWTPGTASSTPGTDRYYVGMNSNGGGASAVTFEYGVVTSNGNVPIMLGTPDAGTFESSGVIQIAIANDKVGAPGAGAVLTLVSGRNFAGNGNATVTKTSAVDSTADGSYTLVGNAFCRANQAPIAALTGSPTSGAPPLTVNFSGAGSSDPDTGSPADTIVSYTFDFGDGTSVTQSTPTVSHTYSNSGDYAARLHVTDSRGLASTNDARVVISVAVNTPPTADLTASPTSGTAPLAVHFDGSGSSDSDFNDVIVSYSFSFGDGTPPVTQGAPMIDHTYTSPGTFTASLVVTDSRGAQSQNAAQQTITVNGAASPSPTATATATPTASATASPTATASATASPTASATATASPIATATASATATATASPVATATATATPTASPTGTPPDIQLVNISGRVLTQSGDKVGIGGFIISGMASKRIMARAIGPSMKVNGTPVQGRLTDPVLELHDAKGSPALFNDNWRSTQESEITQSGLAPSDDKESAIIKRLDPGAYTAIIRNADGSPGIGLIELYDLTSNEAGELGNLSVRAQVQTGDNVLIDGLIIQKVTPKRVLFRALGPSVKTNGQTVPGALPDPTIEVYDSNGTLLRGNDNWKDAPNMSEIQGTGLAPSDDKESAVLLLLPPGSYTSVVKGAAGATGISLSEVYKLTN
jgi:PKD repeat protein